MRHFDETLAFLQCKQNSLPANYLVLIKKKTFVASSLYEHDKYFGCKREISSDILGYRDLYHRNRGKINFMKNVNTV